MSSAAEARQIALSFPEASEQDHHGFPSFRVDGKIFATLPDEEHLNVMLEEDDIRAAVAAHEEVCEEQWWGKKLTALRVELFAVERGLLEAWLGDAWWRRAPSRLKSPSE